MSHILKKHIIMTIYSTGVNPVDVGIHLHPTFEGPGGLCKIIYISQFSRFYNAI